MVINYLFLTTNTSGPSMKYSSGNCGIQNSSNEYYYSGVMDYIKVYNRASTEEEIQALSHEGDLGN